LAAGVARVRALDVKAVVGLGNPGKRYANTPHNVGFAVVNELADGALACRLKKSFRFGARHGTARLEEERILLAKPETYMNRSGRAVAGLLRYWKISPGDMIVVLDDADLQIGRLRVRSGGSSGGHRGLGSVIDCIGTTEFVRVRIGIGRGARGADLVEHVLKPFGKEDGELARSMVSHAADAVMCVLSSGADEAMNRFNGLRQGS